MRVSGLHNYAISIFGRSKVGKTTALLASTSKASIRTPKDSASYRGIAFYTAENYFEEYAALAGEVRSELLAALLEEAGFGVQVAANGNEAVALLIAGEQGDALVTDLSMPGMDGLAVIRAAHERRPGLPAVLLTGCAGDEAGSATGGVVNGDSSLLREPIRIRELLDRIQALLAARVDAAE